MTKLAVSYFGIMV